MNLRSDDGFGLSVSSQGTLFSAPNAGLQQLQTEAASQGRGYASALANTDRSTQGAARTIGLAIGDLVHRLQSEDVSKTHTASSGLADAITRVTSKHVGYALQQAMANTESESSVRSLAAQDGMSFGLSVLGTGATSQLQVTASKNGQTMGAFTLNETQARSFDNAFARSVARDRSLRDALAEGSQIASSHDQRYSFDQAASAINSVDHAQSAERSAREQLERTQAASVTLSMSRETDMALLYWDQHYRAQYGSLDAARTTEQGQEAVTRFYGEMRNLFLDPNRREALGQLAQQALKANPQGLEALQRIERDVEAQRTTLQGVHTTLTTPGAPPSPADHPAALDPLSAFGRAVRAPVLSGSTLMPTGDPAPTTALAHATQNPKGSKPHPVHPHATDSSQPHPAPGHPHLPGEPGSSPGGHAVPSAEAMKSRQALMREGLTQEPQTLGALKSDADVRVAENVVAGVKGQDGGYKPFYKRFLPF